MTPLLFSIKINAVIAMIPAALVYWYIMKDVRGIEPQMSEKPMSPAELFEFEKKKVNLELMGKFIFPLVLVIVPIQFLFINIFGPNLFSMSLATMSTAGIVASYIKYLRIRYIELYENIHQK